MKGSRILIVDMDTIARKNLENRLADEQCEINRATNVRQALDMFKGGYDAVLINAFLNDGCWRDESENVVGPYETPQVVFDHVPSGTVIVFYGGPVMSSPNGRKALTALQEQDHTYFDIGGPGEARIFDYLQERLTLARTA
ncbi:hypothetical protein HOC80_02510 [archaeon]|jgi:CheY-like chemotaxis protein|nr:hypothetical protein [archaeon]MBT4416952.1 hypothetical protein [archaeon]